MAANGIPPSVGCMLDWWLPEVRSCLDEKLRAVLLFGSVALDDFCPGWSDVDVCVVLDTPITRSEGDAVGAIHDEMRRRFIDGGDGSWLSGQAIEGSYIPAELAADSSLRVPCYTAGGSTRKWAVGNPLSPFDRYMLAHHARPVAGERVAFTPPSASDLVGQSEHDLAGLRNWNENSEQSAIWMAGMLHWIARSIVFWRDGRMLSKSDALRHEIERGAEFADAFALSLEIRQAGSATAAARHAELRRHFDDVVHPAAREIERYMRSEPDPEL